MTASPALQNALEAYAKRFGCNPTIEECLPILTRRIAEREGEMAQLMEAHELMLDRSIHLSSLMLDAKTRFRLSWDELAQGLGISPSYARKLAYRESIPSRTKYPALLNKMLKLTEIPSDRELLVRDWVLKGRFA